MTASGSGLSFPDQPRVNLDERLADLVSAATEVQATQGRLRALLRANQTITSQLDLDSLLQSVVEAARTLTGAEEGTFGVLDSHGGLEQFIRVGPDQAATGQIDHLPDRAGGRVALIAAPAVVPLGETAADPIGTGVPATDTPRGNFLSVPVLVRGVAYGDLSLTGHPAGSFSEEDEQLVRSLAATAGFAVDNARLYREMRHREHWAAASAEATAGLLAEGAEESLTLAAERVRALADADSVFLTLVDDERLPRSLIGATGTGAESGHGLGASVAQLLIERVLETRSASRFDEQGVRALAVASTEPGGPAMALPLETAERLLGAIVIARSTGSRSFTATELAVAGDFAARTGVALELARARTDQQRVLLFEDRGRIARDLHDRVIQQLFATGMQLQSVLGTLPEGRNAERVDTAITSLDASIAQIRRIIFTLSDGERADGARTGRQRVLALVRDLASALPVEPQLAFTGPVDAVFDDALTDDVLAVVGEGVTNAVKHGRASAIDIEIAAGPRGVTVTIRNDGSPPADSGRRSGLLNLEERAVRRGGGTRLIRTDDTTVLTWTAAAARAGAAAATG